MANISSSQSPVVHTIPKFLTPPKQKQLLRPNGDCHISLKDFGDKTQPPIDRFVCGTNTLLPSAPVIENPSAFDAASLPYNKSSSAQKTTVKHRSSIKPAIAPKPAHLCSKKNQSCSEVVSLISPTVQEAITVGIAVQVPIIRHYYSHRIPQHAVLAPPPRHQHSVLQSSSPLTVSSPQSPQIAKKYDPKPAGFANGYIVPKPLECYTVKMPRRGFESLRRMPIVVIPRKRKYKNYVSRRRNTQLLASLRRCVSDPVLYKSYNCWGNLWRPFSPEKTKGAATGAPLAVIPEAAVFDERSESASQRKTSKSSNDQFLEEKLGSSKEELKPRTVTGVEKLVPVHVTLSTRIKGDGDVTTSHSDDLLDKKEIEPLEEVVRRAPTPPTTSRAIKPRNLVTRSIIIPKTGISASENELIKQRLSTRSNRDDLYRRNYREYVNLPSVSDDLDEKEEVRTAEEKAQDTVTAVTAAFSTLAAESGYHEKGGGVVGGNDSGGTADIENVEKTGARLGAHEKQTPKIISPSGENISKKHSHVEVPQITAATFMPTTSTKASKPSASLLQNSLLATLQLPPSVSAKVDRIIANANRKEKERRSNQAPVNSVSFCFFQLGFSEI